MERGPAEHSASAPVLPPIHKKGASARERSGSDPTEDNSPSKSSLNKTGTRLPKSNPGPGAYRWNEDVHKNRAPLFTLSSPDRRNLGYKLQSWTPTPVDSMTPDPAAYGDISHLGPHGVHSAPKFKFRSRYPKGSGNPQARDTSRYYDLPGAMGQSHPALHAPPRWSVFGQDRTFLPYDKPTWTPQPVTELRPGPGQYNTSRRPRWMAPNRTGCTFGRRPRDLPLDIPMWVGTTYQQRFRGYS